MKSLVTCLVLIALLCYQCRGQNPERHLAYSVDASIAKMEALSQRFEEMGNQLNTKVEEMGTQMNIKFEELHGRMTTIEDIQRLEQSILKCSSRNQVSDFQSLFTDECAEGNHNCSTLGSCENTVLHYQCSCLPGYEGDGFTCEDVDECSTEPANRCHSQATCTNTAGHYTCSCNPGFSGDGFDCEDVSCDPPAKVIGSLGCVIPVNTLMSWEDAEENCKTKGSRLLEGITTRSQLDQLKQHFRSITHDRYTVWIGLYYGEWIETGHAIAVSSPLWTLGGPYSDQTCGWVFLYTTRPAIGSFPCHDKKPSLCQKS